MMLSTRFLIGLYLLTGLAGAASLSSGVLSAMAGQGESERLSSPAPEKTVVIVTRLKAKERIIEQLLAGEHGLFEAAAWFHALNSAPAEYPEEHWRKLPGRSDGEKTCRQVMIWALNQMRETMPSSQVEAQLRQWEEELEQHIACNGTVVLPVVESPWASSSRKSPGRTAFLGRRDGPEAPSYR